MTAMLPCAYGRRRKVFARKGILDVPARSGVYVLLAKNGSVNFTNVASNLQQALLDHLDGGDVPASYFQFWLGPKRQAMRAAKHIIEDNAPYYNTND